MPETQNPLNNVPPLVSPITALAPLLPLAGIVEDLFADATARRLAKIENRPLGPVTGFPRLDSMLSGSLMPGLHILHGPPGVGKSALALGIACYAQVPALFVSAELGAIEVLRRLISRYTGTYLNYLKDGSRSGEAVRELALKTAAAYPLLGLMDATRHAAPIAHIAEALASIRESPASALATAPGALCVVDSAHTWSGRAFPDETDEYRRLALALDKLEELAQTQGVPVLLIAERSKASAKTGGQGAAAGHRRFEYAGESVLEIDTDKDHEDAHGYKPVKLTISKNRHGSCGFLSLRWHGAMQRHEEVK